jgi:hypothetical protein
VTEWCTLTQNGLSSSVINLNNASLGFNSYALQSIGMA